MQALPHFENILFRSIFNRGFTVIIKTDIIFILTMLHNTATINSKMRMSVPREPGICLYRSLNPAINF